MIDIVALVACAALLVGVGCGLVAHEWSHALALRFAGVEYDIVYGPTRGDGTDHASPDGTLAGLSSGALAVVLPRPTGHEPAWHLRGAALMPLTLAIPILALVSVGPPAWVPAPITTAAALGWLACAIPSPQDFSVAFYAHRVLESELESDAESRLGRD